VRRDAQHEGFGEIHEAALPPPLGCHLKPVVGIEAHQINAGHGTKRPLLSRLPRSLATRHRHRPGGQGLGEERGPRQQRVIFEQRHAAP